MPVRVWPEQFHQWEQVRSDLAVAVFDAVKAAPDITLPIPQCEVRLLPDSANWKLPPKASTRQKTM